MFKALADPTRRRVLQLLRQRPMSAGELAEHFPVSKPTMSAHFSILQSADLIEAEKSGRTVLYRLKMSVLEDALLGFAQTLGWEMKTTDKPHEVSANQDTKSRIQKRLQKRLQTKEA